MIAQQDPTAAQPTPNLESLRAQIKTTQAALNAAVAQLAGVLAQLDAAQSMGQRVALRNGPLYASSDQVDQLTVQLTNLQADLRLGQAIAHWVRPQQHDHRRHRDDSRARTTGPRHGVAGRPAPGARRAATRMGGRGSPIRPDGRSDRLEPSSQVLPLEFDDAPSYFVNDVTRMGVADAAATFHTGPSLTHSSSCRMRMPF